MGEACSVGLERTPVPRLGIDLNTGEVCMGLPCSGLLVELLLAQGVNAGKGTPPCLAWKGLRQAMVRRV